VGSSPKPIKALIEDALCIDLYADLWRKPIADMGWVRGSVEWSDSAGDLLESAYFELSAVGSDGERILGILRGMHLQPIRVGPAKRGYAETYAAWCSGCGKRPYRLYAREGRGDFVCQACSSLDYSSHRKRDYATDRCVKDPAAYLAERAAMQRPTLQTHLVTMRTYQRARQRIIDGR